MAWIRGAAAAVAVLTLSGCAATVAGQAEPMVGAQAGVQRPTDRDGDAVRTALRQLDACALLDNAQPVPLGPHGCAFVLDQKTQDQVDVEVGLESTFSSRFGMIPFTVGGAKAYWQDLGQAGDPQCAVDIPVSFAFAVGLVARPGYHSPSNACDQVKAAAATAVAKLGNPDAVAAPASRPLATWDGCSLLTKALGKLDDKSRLRLMVSDSPYDTCSAEEKADSGATTPLGSVQVRYASDPLSGLNRTPRQVGDKTANVDDLGADCDVEWGVGPSGSTPSHNTVVVDVRLKGCDAATALAVKVQQALAGAAPSGKAQRPLLYGANDPDSDAVGACADLNVDDGNCLPYQPFALPASFDAWFHAADAQPSVGCALAADAVKAVYGDAFKPVVWGEHCIFVEPTHALSITIDVATKYSPGDYGARPDLYANRKTVAVSGKQANTFTDIIKGAKAGEPPYHEYDVYVSPYNDIGRPGMIAGTAEASAPRGAQFGTAPDITRLPALDQLMSKIIAKYVP